MTAQNQDALIRLKEVLRLTGLSRSAIYSAEGEGRFPARVSIGQRSVAWRLSEVQAWIASRQPKKVAA